MIDARLHLLFPFRLFFKACTDASWFYFACSYSRFTIYWFLLLGNSAFGNGLDGLTEWIIAMHCILSCLLVLRQLDRQIDRVADIATKSYRHHQ